MLSAGCGNPQVCTTHLPLAPALTLLVDVLIRAPNSPLVPAIGRNLVLYNIYNETGLVSGSQPLVDAVNSTGSPWSLNVQRPQGMPPFATGMMVQVIGCSLSTSTGQATIDATTNQLLNSVGSLKSYPPAACPAALMTSFYMSAGVLAARETWGTAPHLTLKSV